MCGAFPSAPGLIEETKAPGRLSRLATRDWPVRQTRMHDTLSGRTRSAIANALGEEGGSPIECCDDHIIAPAPAQRVMRATTTSGADAVEMAVSWVASHVARGEEGMVP